ncbi:MAG: hypothetical protein Q7R57_02135, partial [Dehalococcoidales bacterium]|nr:hypothetical protein [Dehalococcoidales bacterium]
MKKLFAGISLLLILVVSFACSKAPAPSPLTDKGISPPGPAQGGIAVPPLPPGAKPPSPTITVTQAPRPTPSPAPAPGTSDSSQYSEIDRMIVRTGQMTMLVDDIPAAVDKITQLSNSYKGYVVSSN